MTEPSGAVEAVNECTICKGFRYLITAPSTCSAGGEKRPCPGCIATSVNVVPAIAAMLTRSDQEERINSLILAIRAAPYDVNDDYADVRRDERERIIAAMPTPSDQETVGAFQERVQPWLMACFGEMIAGDREERNHRFLEEALELVQALGCSASEAHQLVDYVYGRDVGEPAQEVGGVMVTLAALCLANKLDMHVNGETELARIWTKVEAIRVKQAAKPKHSPLPQHVPTPSDQEELSRAMQEALILIDEINERGESRRFYGICQPTHSKLCTIRATLQIALARTRPARSPK